MGSRRHKNKQVDPPSFEEFQAKKERKLKRQEERELQKQKKKNSRPAQSDLDKSSRKSVKKLKRE